MGPFPTVRNNYIKACFYSEYLYNVQPYLTDIKSVPTN
jgi:hypothetical protein